MGALGSEAAAARLSALRRGSPACAPLWIEALPAEQALVELEGREGPVFGLQRARFLAELGRAGEASDLLSGLGDLPAGLAAVRDRLRDSLAGALPVRGTSEGLSAPASRLERWLALVRRWRGPRDV